MLLTGKDTSVQAPRKLSDADKNSIAQQRVCIKSFPWPEALRTPEGAPNLSAISPEQMASVRQHLKELVEKARQSQLPLLSTLSSKNRAERNAIFRILDDPSFQNALAAKGFPRQAAELARIAGSIKSLPDVDQQFYFAVSNGLDLDQLSLYADFLYGRIMASHGEWQRVADCVAEAKTAFALQVRPVTFDEMDEHTYFSKEALGNMLSIQDFEARAHLIPNTLSDRAALISKFLDERPALLSYYEIAGDPEKQLGRLFRQEDVAQLKVDGESWKRMTALNDISSIHGAFRNGDDVYVIMGTTGISGIRYSSDEGVTFLGQDEIRSEFMQFCKTEIGQRSTTNLRLLGAFKSGDGALVVLADGSTIELSKDEYRSVLAGNRLPDSHRLTSFMDSKGAKVLYSNPLMAKEGEALANSEAFAFGLQKAYRTESVFRDPLSDRTDGAVARIRQFRIKKGSDIVVVLPSEVRSVPLTTTITNITPELRGAKVNIRTFRNGDTYTGSRGKAVFVLTGHSSEELAEFVRAVGEAGFFRDNYVILNSCATPVTRELVTEINSRYGAIGTYSFSGAIDPALVQDYMLDFLHQLEGNGSINVLDKLRDSVLKEQLVGTFTVCLAN